jgi:hypothetical protein
MPFVPDDPVEEPKKEPSRFIPDSAPAASAGPVDNRTWQQRADAYLSTGTNPGASGIANFAAGAAGFPVDAIQAGLNIPSELTRTGLMAAGRYDLAGRVPTIQGSVGGSDWIKDMLRRTGVGFLNPDNPTPNSTFGKAAYDLASKGAFIPGGVLPAVAGTVAERTLGPEYAAPASLAPATAITSFNAARAPTLAKQQAQNVVRDQTLADAQREGYVSIPSQVNASAVSTTLESLGGKAAVKQQAEQTNQAVTDAIARREVGLPDNAPLKAETLEARRSELAQPYRDLAAVSPNASYFLRELRDARQKASGYWAEYERNATVSALENYKKLSAKAEAMETKLEGEARSAGRPDLVQSMREARTAIAKTWNVQNSLNLGDGHVDAQAMGRQLDNGAKLSGGLLTMAKFAQGPGAQVTREISRVPTPGVSALKFPAAAGAASGSYAFMHDPLLSTAAFAAPFVLPPAARSVLFSDRYQNMFARPDYTPAINPESPLQTLIRSAMLGNQTNQ